MRKLKCLSNFRAGYTFLAAMILGFAFLFTVGGVPSMSNADDVYLELITTGSDNWTQSGSIETFNFTINNTNASLSITQVNISMPLGAGGNADFAVDMSTDDTSDALWGCYNITIDGAGNITLIECNTSSAYLTDGSVISIWFDADAASTSAEDVYQWNVTVLNETNGYVVSQNISGGIDGLAPRISDMGVNVTYVDTDDNIMIWANVTDATFRNASVQAVNASNVTEPCGPDSEIVCESLGGFSRNCTVSGPWGGFEGNYSFNVTSYDNASHSTEVTYPGWFFADLTAPTVTLNYPANGGWDADGDVEFNFTPYDTSLSLANCSVWVGNATGGNWQFNETNGTTLTNNQENNITVYGFSTDADQQVQYIWNVRCWDQVANSSFASQNFTVNVGNRSNIIVESVTFDGPGGKSPYAGKNVTVNVTLLNNGTANVENTTTIRVYFDDDSSPSVDELEKNDTVIVQNTSLTSGSYHSVIYEFAVPADGDYYVLAEADYGTSNETEQYEDDNTLTNSFSTFLNITVNSVTEFNVNATQNVTVNVTVLYDNGDPVSTLSSMDNFSIYDRWNAKDMERTETDPLPNTTLGDFDPSGAGGGVYTFNYTVPGPQVYFEELSEDEEWYTATYAEYGLHDINVMASLTDDTGITGNYTGNSSYTGSDNSYNLTAPFLRLDVTSFEETMTVGDEDGSNYIFHNDGNVPIPAGEIDVESDDDGDDIISFEFVEPDDEDYTIEVELAPGGSNETEGLMDAVAAGTENLTVTGEYTYDGVVYSYTGILQVVVSAAGDDDGDDDDTGGTTPSGGIQYDCITDSDCDSDEECDSDFMCVEIECDAGYYATGHTCKIKPVFEIEISEYESELSVLQGESVETVVYVNNTGNEDLTAMLTVEMELENVSFNVTPPSRSVGAGKTSNFTLSFNISDGARAGKHTLSYKVTTSSIAKDTKSFILSIQPLPEIIEEIKQSYQNYTVIVSQLLADFNAGKGQLSASNLTAMETKINATETLFNSLKEAMENEDYAQAATYIDELNALAASTRALMEEFGISGMSGGFWNAVLLWIVVGVVCVGAVGLLIYMMVPPQGYALGKGYAPQDGGVTNKLKNAMLSLRGVMPGSKKPTSAAQIVQKYKPAYSSGYDKLSGSYRSQPGGLAERMKKTFNKKK